MAPAAKLSQTRLTTAPRKPPAAGGALSFAAAGRSNSVKAKTKSRPNQSILSFFKKAPARQQQQQQDEPSLFIDGGDAEVGVAGAVELVEGLEQGGEQEQEQKQGRGESGDEDLYGASPPRPGGSPTSHMEEEARYRYNEAGGPVKRRRLSPGVGGVRRDETPGEAASEEAPKATEPPLARAPRKKNRAGNPFLDDDSSSSSEDDSDDDRNDGTVSALATAAATTTTSTTTRVRPPEHVFSRSDGVHGVHETEQRDPLPGPAALTNDGVFSREVMPPLRQQTSSGADRGSDERGGAKAEDDGVPLDEDPPRGCGAARGADPFEDEDGEDFTAEELRAMRCLEEQARLEVEEEEEEEEQEEEGDESCAGGGGGGGNGDDDETLMAVSCPVCNGCLAGATTEQATAHVNSCLDGNPTPLPRPPTGGVVEGAGMVGKRFARAAVARPGQANPISLSGDDMGRGPANSAFAKLMSGHAEDAAWATAAAAETASRGMPAYKRTCPFYKIMPGFSICVDAFRYGAVEGCRAYFLSHFHSDHYMGLTANWTHGPIYCSKVTASLVKSQLRTAAKYVVELEFEETVPIPETNGVTVTMIPANHCPGSALFLFEKPIGDNGGRTQRILHCGDFRACPAHVEHPLLRPETVDAVSGKTKQQRVDVCYLDTTYLNPRYSFPPQSDVINACAELCALLNKGLMANDDREWDALLRRREGAGNSGTESVSKFFTAASSSSSTSSSSSSSKPSAPQPTDAFSALKRPNRNRNRNRLLVVCGTYSIGKERICVAIAKALNTKIYAAPAKIRMCKQLGDAELASLLTADPREAQVHMHMLMEIRADTLAEYLEEYKADFSRVVGFRPSGWNYRPPGAPFSSTKKNSRHGNGNGNGAGVVAPAANLAPAALPTTELLHGPAWRPRLSARDLVPQRGSSRTALCFGVPYSEHSSFRELALFVMALRIDRVVPTVGVGSEAARRRMRAWLDRWMAERRRGGLVRVLREGLDDVQAAGGLWKGRGGKGGGVFW